MRAILNLLAVIFAAICTMFFSCSQEKRHAAPKPVVRKVSRVVYAIYPYGASSPEPALSGLAAPDTIIRTVLFDGESSAVSEISAVFGFFGTVTATMKAGDSLATASTNLVGIPVCGFTARFEPGIPDSLEPEFTGETTRLRGYDCEEAIFRSGNLSWRILFTRAFGFKDVTNAVIAHRQIPGAVLEMRKRYSVGKAMIETVYAVTKADLSVQEKLPSQCTDPLLSLDEARNRMLTVFDSLTAAADTLPWREKDRFPGKWSARNAPILLIVERFGEAYVASAVNSGKRQSLGEVRFFNGKLCVFTDGSWLFFSLSGAHRLICDSDPDFILTRSLPG
jgi:hypothetical protein